MEVITFGKSFENLSNYTSCRQVLEKEKVTNTHKSRKCFILFLLVSFVYEYLVVENECVSNCFLHLFFAALDRGVWNRPPLLSVCSNQDPDKAGSKQV